MPIYTPSTNRGGQLSRTIVASICAGASVQNALVSIAEVFCVVSLTPNGASHSLFLSCYSAVYILCACCCLWGSAVVAYVPDETLVARRRTVAIASASVLCAAFHGGKPRVRAVKFLVDETSCTADTELQIVSARVAYCPTRPCTLAAALTLMLLTSVRNVDIRASAIHIAVDDAVFTVFIAIIFANVFGFCRRTSPGPVTVACARILEAVNIPFKLNIPVVFSAFYHTMATV